MRSALPRPSQVALRGYPPSALPRRGARVGRIAGRKVDTRASDATIGAMRKGKWRRRAVLLGIVPALVLGLWIAIHRVPWLGPLLADAGRAVLGPTAIARLEDFAYGVQDRVNVVTHEGDRPEAYWEVPAPSSDREGGSRPGSSGADRPAAARPSGGPPPFRPADVPPMHASWSAPGDGTWVPIEDPRRPDDPPAMYKTLLHPDKNRSWTAVSLVAIDLRQTELHLVAGRHEPESEEKAAAGYERKAIVPAEDRDVLLAAFNGGFKSTHGHHGMKVDGVTLIRPRKDSCTLARYQDGTYAVRTWSAIAEGEDKMLWWRQTPGCMREQGQMHPGLVAEGNRYWGSTLEGETVIRRSAVGLSADGNVLFVGIGDSTTAGSIARAMAHAGADGVAQLDVNWSYPKFIVYRPRDPGSSELVATPLCKGFEMADDEYLGQRAQRDFFYVTRKRAPTPHID